MSNISDEITYYLNRPFKEVRHWFRCLKYGIKNLIYYFHVIWNDRQWDFYYIEQLWLKKYEAIYKRMDDIESLTLIPQGHEKYKQSLRLIINILKRRDSSFYTDLYGDAFDKWDNIVLVSKVEERDWKTLCKLIEKYQEHYWD